jgi:hypothetical protein
MIQPFFSSKHEAVHDNLQLPGSFHGFGKLARIEMLPYSNGSRN